MNSAKRLLAVTIAATSAHIAHSAKASSLALEEVVVTAQKRDESLQEVGISVTAFSGNQLEELNFNTASDVTAMTPNVESRNVIGGRGVQTLFFVRGIGQTDFNDGTESPVTAYVDEFYLISPAAVDFLLMDIESAEVLRGPQGTLFGRNATGGAIQYSTRRPDLQGFSANVEVGAGNYDYESYEGFVNVPITETLAMRISGSKELHDPYVDNIHPEGNDSQEGNFRALRGQLLWQPTDDLTLVFKADTGKAKGFLFADQHMPTQAGYGAVIAADVDVFGYSEVTETDLLGDESLIGGISAGNKANANGYNYADNESDHYLLTAEWETENFTLTSITGYMDQDKGVWEDCDGGPYTICTIVTDFESNHFTQELRLNGSTDSFDWTTGIYYLNQDASVDAEGALFLGDASVALGDPNIGGIVHYVDWERDLKSYAAYGQIEYHFSPEWTGILGLRASRDENHFEMTKRETFTTADHGISNPRPADWGNFPIAATFGVLDFTDSNAGNLTEQNKTSWSGTLQLNWTPNDDLLLYGSYRRGVKSGGFNNGFINIGPVESMPYDQEVLYAYEAGYKWTLAGGLARLNGAFFYYDYQDYQASFYEGLGIFVTNTDANMSGAEVELVTSPTDGLDIWLGASYLDTEAENVPNLGIVMDREMGNAPKITANGVIRYSWNFMGGTMAAQLSASYTDERYTDVLNNPVLELDSYTNIDANISYTAPEDNWKVMLYSKNLTDEDKPFSLFEIHTAGNIGQQNYMPPRQYGIKLSYSWF